jgi:hypothetical protein
MHIGSPESSWTFVVPHSPFPKEVHLIERPLNEGEVTQLIGVNGNHWRKIFSIMAKFRVLMHTDWHDTWQSYRDNALLTLNGREDICIGALPSEINKPTIITGHTFAKDLTDLSTFDTTSFSDKILYDKSKLIFVTPYLDYRQFPNALLEQFAEFLTNR